MTSMPRPHPLQLTLKFLKYNILFRHINELMYREEISLSQVTASIIIRNNLVSLSSNTLTKTI